MKNADENVATCPVVSDIPAFPLSDEVSIRFSVVLSVLGNESFVPFASGAYLRGGPTIT